MKFKIGDYIEPIDDRYPITNKTNHFVGKIKKIFDENYHLLVEVIECDRDDWKSKYSSYKEEGGYKLIAGYFTLSEKYSSKKKVELIMKDINNGN